MGCLPGREIGDYEINSSFGFMDETNYELIITCIFILPNRSEQAEFDMVMPFMGPMVAGALSGDMEGATELEFASDTGDSISGASLVVPGPVEQRMDMVFFRRGKLAAMIMVIYFDGDTPPVPIFDFVEQLDANFVEFLSAEQ